MDGQLIQRWMKSCRLCLLDDGVKLPIFGEEGIVREVAHKIQTCFPMIVLYNADPLSKIICQRCLFMLDTVFNFRQKCVETNQVFTSHLTGLKSNSSSVKQYLLALEKNGIVASSSIVQKSTPINSPESLKSSNQSNQRSSSKSFQKRSSATKSRPRPVQTDPLSITNMCSSPIRIKQEVIDCSEESSSGKSTPLIISVVGSYSDVRIEESAAGPGSVSQSAPKPPENGPLPGTVKVKQEWQLFNNKLHSRLKSFKVITPWHCKFCNKYYKSKDTQYKHRKYFCPYKSVPCKKCNQVFKSKHEMITHSSKHLTVHVFLKEEDLHPCKVCKKRFANEGMLATHMQMHSNTFIQDALEPAESENILAAAPRKNPNLPTTSVNAIRKRIFISRNSRGSLNKRARSFCPYCPSSYAMPAKLTYHKKKIHLEEWLEEQELKEQNERAMLPAPVQDVAPANPQAPPEKSNVIRSALHRPGPLSKQRAKRPVHHGLLRELLNKKILKCPICNKVLGSPVGLQNHMRSHNNGSPMGPKVNRCTMCGRLFGSKGGLSYHMATQHTSDDPCRDAYRCQPCNITFSSRPEWFQHKLSNCMGGKRGGKLPVIDRPAVSERPKLLLCSYCNQVFSESAELKAHQLTHKVSPSVSKPAAKASNPAAKACNPAAKACNPAAKACNPAASATNPAASATHPAHNWKRLDRENGVWPCTLCTKVCSTKRNLSRHSKTHELRAHCSHPCNQCGKKFISKAALVRHEAVSHATGKSFRCVKCSRIFFRKGIYLNHVCGASLEMPKEPLTPGDSAVVVERSADDQMYENSLNLCSKCGFTRTIGHKCDMWMDHLQTNPVKRHVSRRTYKCRICGATFASSYSHNSHMKAHVNQRNKKLLILKVPGALQDNVDFSAVPLLEESVVSTPMPPHQRVELPAPLDLSYVEPAGNAAGMHLSPSCTDQVIEAAFAPVNVLPTNGGDQLYEEHEFFQCTFCTKTFHSQQGLAAHSVSHEGAGSNLLSCPFCARKCADSQGLNLHILLNHPNVDGIKDSVSMPQNVNI